MTECIPFDGRLFCSGDLTRRHLRHSRSGLRLDRHVDHGNAIDLAGLRPDDGDGAEATDEELDDGMVEAFREFIENVDPEDFLG